MSRAKVKQVLALMLAFCLMMTGMMQNTVSAQAAGLKSVTVKSSNFKTKKGVSTARYKNKAYNNMSLDKTALGRTLILQNTDVKGNLTVSSGKTKRGGGVTKVKLTKDSYVGKVVAKNNVNLYNYDSIVRLLSVRNGAKKIKTYGKLSAISVPASTKNARVDVYAAVPRVVNKGKNVDVIFHNARLGNYTVTGSGNTNIVSGKTAALVKITGSKNKTSVKNATVAKVYDVGSKSRLSISKSKIHDVTFAGKAGTSLIISGSAICNLRLKDKNAEVKIVNSTVEHLYAPDGIIININGEKIIVYGDDVKIVRDKDGNTVIYMTDANGKDVMYVIGSNKDNNTGDNTGDGSGSNTGDNAGDNGNGSGTGNGDKPGTGTDNKPGDGTGDDNNSNTGDNNNSSSTTNPGYPGGPSGHTHHYSSETITKQPTCTEAGEKKLTCSCGASKTESVPATGHKAGSEFVTDKQPTCETEGSKSKHCETCGAVIDKTIEKIPAKGHTAGDDYVIDKQPTDTEDGVKSKHCVDCNKPIPGTETAYTKEEADAAGSGSGNTGSGDNTGNTGDSGNTGSGDNKDPEKHEHAYTETIIKQPTCTEEGEKKLECSCGDVKTESIAAKGHTAGDDYVVDKNPTCTEEGSKSKHCVDCDAVIDGSQMTVPAKGHTESEEYTVDKDQTDTEDGVKSKHCTECGESIPGTEVVIHEHRYVETVVRDATCTEDGEKQLTCACGDTKTEALPATGHVADEEYTVDTAATCQSEGVKSKHCLNCGAVIDGTQVNIDKTKHEYVNNDILFYDSRQNAYLLTPSASLSYPCDITYGTCNLEITVSEDTSVKTVYTRTGQAQQVYIQNVEASSFYDYPREEGTFEYELPLKAGLNHIEIGFYNQNNKTDVGTVFVKLSNILKNHSCKYCGKAEDHTYVNHFCACGSYDPDTENTPCEHVFKDGVCQNCGETDPNYTESSDSCEHVVSDVYTIDKESTCTANGMKSKHCTICGEVVDGTQVPVFAKSHDFVDGKCIYCGISENNPNTVMLRSSIADSSYFLGIDYKSKGYCEAIYFETSATGHYLTDDYTYDVSDEQDGSILAWIGPRRTGIAGNYSIHVAPKKEGNVIKLQSNVSKLFYGLYKEGCVIYGMETLDLSGVRSFSKVTSTSDCIHVFVPGISSRDLGNLGSDNKDRNFTPEQYIMMCQSKTMYKEYMAGWDYYIDGDTVYLIRYTGDDDIVTVTDTVTIDNKVYHVSILSNIWNMYSRSTGLFFNNDSVREIHLNNVSLPQYSLNMFYDCDNLEVVKFNNCNTSDVDYINSMFEGCDNLKELDFSSCNLAGVYQAEHMFLGCKSLVSVDFRDSKFGMALFAGNRMFKDCVSLDVVYHNYDKWNVDKYNDVWKNCKISSVTKV